MRFRKSIKIVPGIKINLSKSGVSMTIGKKGLSMNIGKKGTYLNTGIPGTGIYDRKKISDSGQDTPPPTTPVGLSDPSPTENTSWPTTETRPHKKKNPYPIYILVDCTGIASRLIILNERI